MRCVIYYWDNNKGKAQNKLIEIIGDKVINGVTILHRFDDSRVVFSNDEDWTIVNVAENRKDFRWEKAFIDKTIPEWIVHNKLFFEAAIYSRHGIWYPYTYEWF